MMELVLCGKSVFMDEIVSMLIYKDVSASRKIREKAVIQLLM